jgi:hypothetical protein
MSKYVSNEFGAFPFPSIRMGKLGEPVTLVEGGVYATGEIVFANDPTAADTITINGTSFEFVASGATGNEINIAGTLPGTLDNMLTILNGSEVVGVAEATYTEDGVDTLTITHNSYDVDGNTFTLAASSDTPSGALLTGGQDIPDDRSSFGPTDFAITQAVDQNFLLEDGDESQRKFVYMTTKSGAGNAVVTPTSLRGGTTITFSAAGHYSELRFMNGEWVQTAGTATVA